jgi:hypothetical protein
MVLRSPPPASGVEAECWCLSDFSILELLLNRGPQPVNDEQLTEGVPQE